MKTKNIFIVMVLLAGFCLGLHAQPTKISQSSYEMRHVSTSSKNTVLESAVGRSFVGESHMSTTHLTSNLLAGKMFSSMSDANEPTLLPEKFQLMQNYPNPFNPRTTIHYNLPGSTRVSLKIYNVLSQIVATLVDETQDGGYKSVDWDASTISSGVYFYRLQASNFTQTLKLLLLK